MPNQQLWILNDAMEESPVGVPGQIYIGGAGLALEYWHDAEKTTAQFVHHPKTHVRLYRTGDLGVWHSDGVIQFLGRVDNQVKIAGHRVELGEIEQTIKGVVGVTACVVELYSEPSPQLVAYLCYEPSDVSPVSALVPVSYCAGAQRRLQDFDFSLAAIEKSENEWVADFSVSQLDELYRHAVLKLFDELNLFTTSKEMFSVVQLIQKTGILPRYEKWLRRALDALVEFGDLQVENHQYRANASLPKANVF